MTTVEDMIERLKDYDLELILYALAELGYIEEIYYYLDLEPKDDE